MRFFCLIICVILSFCICYGDDIFTLKGDNIENPWYAKVAQKSYRLYIDVQEQKYVAIDMDDPSTFLPWWDAMILFPAFDIGPHNYREASTKGD